MSKFICPTCKKESEIKNYTIGVVEGETAYFIRKTQRRLECSEDGAVLKIVKEKVDFSNISFNSFSSKSAEDRQKILQKRSSQHFQREIKERKHEMGKATIKHLLNK